MIQKHPILPGRIRKVPKQFSWVDQRLVSHHYIERCSHQAATLYLFLIAVADARGLSYYSDPVLIKRLNMDRAVLANARHELAVLKLIAWQKPIYQVLPIGDAQEIPLETSTSRDARPISIGQILKNIRENA